MIDAPTVKAIINVVPHTDLSEYNYHPTYIVCKSTQVVVHKKNQGMIGKQNKRTILLWPHNPSHEI